MRTHSVIAALAVVFLTFSASVFAQPSPKAESEYLVPPGGGAFDVVVHAGEVSILSFPGEKLASSALASSGDFEIKAWGTDGVAVRPNGKTTTATLALATVSGAIKVNVTLRVVPGKEPAQGLVRFKASTVEDAFAARVKDEVAREIAPLKEELAKTRETVDQLVRERAERTIADRMLRRLEWVELNTHERNDDNVIVHVDGATMMGDDGYVFWTIENRSAKPFRVARAEVIYNGKPLDGLARLFSSGIDADPAVIGVVLPRTSARGVVLVRSTRQVKGNEVALEVSDPSGSGAIRVTHGIVLR